jgi:hypothetical protein
MRQRGAGFISDFGFGHLGHFPRRLAAFCAFSQNYFCVQVFGNSHYSRKPFHPSHFRKKQKNELLPTVGRNFFKSVI